MQTLVMIFHILACLALILIVLLQTGRGAEMGAAFGGSSQTLFGSTGGTTFLGKLTTVAAIVFMLTCLGLTYFSSAPDTRSVMEKVKVEEKQEPALPEAIPVPVVPGQAESAAGKDSAAAQAEGAKAPANVPASPAVPSEGSQSTGKPSQ